MQTYQVAHSVDKEHVLRHEPLVQPKGEQLAAPEAWHTPAPLQICPATESPVQMALPQLVPADE